MSLLFFDSFDLPSAISYWTDGPVSYTTTGYSGWEITEDQGRRSTSAFSSGGGAYWLMETQLTLPSSYTELILGFAVQFTTARFQDFLSFYNSTSGAQCAIRFNADSTLSVYTAVGGTELAVTSSPVIVRTTYQYCEIKLTCTGVDTIEIRLDGVTVLSASGLNLRTSGSGSLNGIRWRSDHDAAPNTIYVDDLYICDTAGASFNDFLGDVKVTAFVPTGDGDHADFTPSTGTDHYACVAAIANNVEEDVPTSKDSYTYTITGDMPTIHAVSLDTIARNPETGIAEGTPFWRIGATDYDEDPFERGDTSERNRQIAMGNPATGGIWTQLDLETTQTGIQFSRVVS